MEQESIDPFRHQNRYNDRNADWPSEEVFTHPLRTIHNGWQKWHADRDCGRETVNYLENNSGRVAGERYEYVLYCFNCGHKVPENEVLFIEDDWYYDHAMNVHEAMFDDLWLPSERVLELGPNPDMDELLHALDLTRVEKSARSDLLQCGIPAWDGPYECEDCGDEIAARLDGCCDECYDGELTDEMVSSVHFDYENA